MKVHFCWLFINFIKVRINFPHILLNTDQYSRHEICQVLDINMPLLSLSVTVG